MRPLLPLFILLAVALAPAAAAASALPCAWGIGCAGMETETEGAGTCDDPWPYREERRAVTLALAGETVVVVTESSCYGSSHLSGDGTRGGDLALRANTTGGASVALAWHEDASWGPTHGASRVCEHAYEARTPVPDPMAPERALRVEGGGPCVAGIGPPS